VNASLAEGSSSSSGITSSFSALSSLSSNRGRLCISSSKGVAGWMFWCCWCLSGEGGSELGG
jgi:hypothetical protein